MRLTTALVFLLALACTGGPSAPATLAEARQGLVTTVFLPTDPAPPAEPDPAMFDLVRYPAPLGDNVAYVTPERTGEKRPAIIWIAGGFDWGIGPVAWEEQGRENDQSARAFREAGMALMLPALRGSNGNPGANECMLGEVDDVVAAARWLATRSDVDPDRIWVGGHSTGGTLALLVAESRPAGIRGVVAFGPIDDVREYGDRCVPGGADEREWQARSPEIYASTITIPTWIVEGENGNARGARHIRNAGGSAPIETLLVPGRDHFSVLAPGTEVVAAAILADTGPTVAIAITEAAILAR